MHEEVEFRRQIISNIGMKTIFLSINRGLLARNILRTDAFRILRDHSDIRIVIFVPPGIPNYFRREFEAKGKVVLEEIHPFKYGAFRRFIFLPFLQGLLFTDTTKIIYKYGSRQVKRLSTISYAFRHALYTLLRRFASLKRAVRWVEFHWYKDAHYDNYFNTYEPDLVFTPTIMSVADLALLKSAKRRGIHHVAMPKSWDHLDKFLHPFVPECFIVHNRYLKDAAIKLQEYPPASVLISGHPQFDMYVEREHLMSREDFCRKLRLDPSRKLIMFGSAGVWTPQDEDVVEMLYQWIMEGSLRESCALLIRPHSADCHKKRFERFKGRPNLAVVDYRVTDYFPDHWDPSEEEMVEFVNVLAHMDLNINSFSTLTLDAACFDKPVVNVAFDIEKTPFKDSIIHMYERANYREVVESGAVRMAYSAEIFKAELDRYLEHPEYEQKERRVLRERLCGTLDGKAGDRIARHLLHLVKVEGGRDLALRQQEVIVN